MRRHTLHFLFLVSYLVFVSSYTFFYPYLPPSLSWSKYFNCITFVLTTFHSYDTRLPCSSFHNPLSLHRQIPNMLSFLVENLNFLGFIYPAENSLTVNNLDNTFNAYFVWLLLSGVPKFGLRRQKRRHCLPLATH